MSAPLTKRERVMRAVRFQETDRVPIHDIDSPLLLLGDPEEVRAVCRQMIRDAAGGLLLGFLDRAPLGGQFETEIAMFETA